MECPLQQLGDWRTVGRRGPFSSNFLMEPELQSSSVAGCLDCVAPRHFLIRVSPKQILPVGCPQSRGQVVLSPNECSLSFPENRVVPPVGPVSTPTGVGTGGRPAFPLLKATFQRVWFFCKSPTGWHWEGGRCLEPAATLQVLLLHNSHEFWNVSGHLQHDCVSP